MANLNFDNNAIEVPCPKCGYKLRETLGRLKAQKNFVCGGCGQSITVDTSNFDQTIRGLNFRLP